MAKQTTVTPTPDRHNANAGTKAGKKMLHESVKRLGYGRSILLDRKNQIIAGNKTFEEANEQGVSEVRIVETDGTELIAVKRTDLDLDTDPKARELAFADNRVAEINLEWDPGVLRDDLAEQNLNIEWMFQTEIGALQNTTPDVTDDDMLDVNPSLDTKFLLEVECTDEQHQEKLFNTLTEMGLTCRVLTL